MEAFAAVNHHLRVTQIEASQFPILMGKHLVTEVPSLSINGHRFVGHYNESQLAEQVERVLAGSDEPVCGSRCCPRRT